MERRERRTDGPIDPEQLKFLAAISTEWEEERCRRQRADAEVKRQQELQEFVDAITAPPGLARVPTSKDVQRFVDAITDRGDELIGEGYWDATKHPRRGGPPNAGWWASTGGGASAGHAHASRGMFNVPTERVQTRIKLASGKNWNGDRVLDALTALAPGWVPFLKQHVTLARASTDTKSAETIVRHGENGLEVDATSGTVDAPGHKTIHFHIPDDWNDVQVVQYILAQFADHSDAYRLAAQWAGDGSPLFGELRHERFRNGLTTAAALARGYYTALAGLAPGGGVAVAAWDIGRGDHLGAALGAAFMLPLGKLAKAGIESGGAILIRAGDKLIAALPIKVIQRIQKLAPEQLTVLEKRLLGAKTKEDVATIVDTFLSTPFDRHHPLPKFLGGDLDQIRAAIPRSVHKQFHDELRKELKAAGFDLPIGSPAGGTEKWLKHFGKNPGSQTKAFNAVLKASGTIDSQHGTNIGDFVIKNLMGDSFLVIP